jgi:hypothetical protein
VIVLEVALLVLGLVMLISPRTPHRRWQDSRTRALQEKYGGGPTTGNLILARVIGAFLIYVMIRVLYEGWVLGCLLPHPGC